MSEINVLVLLHIAMTIIALKLGEHLRNTYYLHILLYCLIISISVHGNIIKDLTFTKSSHFPQYFSSSKSVNVIVIVCVDGTVMNHQQLVLAW